MLFRVALALRSLMFIAAVGAGVGALLMFWEAGAKLVTAVRSLAAGHGTAAASVTGSIMSATDGLLFGVVLLVFASAIAFGFAVELTPDQRSRLPGWMTVTSLGELKSTLLQVILVYLVVDFATDVAELDTHLSWNSLVLPLAVLLISAALRLMPAHHKEPAGT